LENNEHFDIDLDARREMMKSMKRASDFLGDCSILDYSTLVGVIDLTSRKKLFNSGLLDHDDPIYQLLKINPEVPPYRG